MTWAIYSSGQRGKKKSFNNLRVTLNYLISEVSYNLQSWHGGKGVVILGTNILLVKAID